MRFLFHIFGSLLTLALVATGLLFIVAPSIGRRMLQYTATSAGISLIVLVILNSVLTVLSSHPFVLVLIAVVVCTTAYVIRERRMQHPKRGEGMRHAERTPIIPTYIGGGDDA
jgi:chromate transport protein ChrA